MVFVQALTYLIDESFQIEQIIDKVLSVFSFPPKTKSQEFILIFSCQWPQRLETEK